MEEQRQAILENRRMTYCEMRELMGWHSGENIGKYITNNFSNNH
jgi:hypothetical protein